jgi:hypothetical protein
MSTPEEEEITIHQVRPRFRVETKISMSELTDRINTALKSGSAPCRGFVKNGHGRLTIPPQDQHYWSPQLSLSMEEEDGTTIIRGLYGPRPTVWTMFVFFYAAIGFAILIISLIGASYVTLEKSASILWAVPILVVVFLSLYLVAYSGKKLGYDQIVTLHGFIEECTGLDIKG